MDDGGRREFLEHFALGRSYNMIMVSENSIVKLNLPCKSNAA